MTTYLWFAALMFFLHGANGQTEGLIFVADGVEGILMANFSGDNLDSLTFSKLNLSSVMSPLAVTYDPDTRIVYWSESTGSIRRGNIDGTYQRVIAIGAIGSIRKIALVTSHGKMYWTDARRILSANLDGSSKQVLISTDIVNLSDIIVDPQEGVMFWTDISGHKSEIERANLDGGERHIIVNSSLLRPRGLAFNADGSRIYFIDDGTDKIESVDRWGRERKVHLATSGIHPLSLAVIDDSILWSDFVFGAIGAFNTSHNQNSSHSYYYGSVFIRPQAIHVYKHDKVDGVWSAWGEWHQCNKTCGEGGTRTRFRSCTQPRPQYGGRDCQGSGRDTMPCPTLPPCPDIDECTTGTAKCDVNARCLNTVGSYTCQCNDGYMGNGTTCSGGRLNNRPVVIGCTVTAILLLLIIALVVFFCCCTERGRRMNKRGKHADEKSKNHQKEMSEVHVNNTYVST